MEQIKRSKFYNLNLFLVFFLGLSGYYVILILIANMGLNSVSRMFTIPVRLIVVFSLLILNTRSLLVRNSQLPYKLFLFFSFVYLIRIFLEALNNKPIYISEWDILIYFLSFMVIPFILMSKIEFTETDYKKIFMSILIGALGVALLTYFYYGQLIGRVSRITEEVSRNENFISPLALSYCSVLGICIGLSYLLTNKVSKFRLLFILISILVCLVPFFLGSSRGSVFAILVPFILYVFFSKGLGNKIRFWTVAGVVVLAFIESTNYFGEGLFNRFTSISKDIDNGNSSAVRIEFWKAGIEQFMAHPFFGNSLQSEYAKFHPHNIFIEILISTGIIGFIPFFIFVILIFKNIVIIIKTRQKYFWLTNVFLIGFIQNMFTGAIWSASWTAIGAALILSLSQNKKLE